MSMTENSAIEMLKYRIATATEISGKGADGKAFEDMELAIQALEEVQKYRAIGTVEEFETLKKEKVQLAAWEEKTVTCKFCGYKHLVDEDYPLDQHCHRCGRDMTLPHKGILTDMDKKIEYFKKETNRPDVLDFDVEHLIKACGGDVNQAIELIKEMDKK